MCTKTFHILGKTQIFSEVIPSLVFGLMPILMLHKTAPDAAYTKWEVAPPILQHYKAVMELITACSLVNLCYKVCQITY